MGQNSNEKVLVVDFSAMTLDTMFWHAENEQDMWERLCKADPRFVDRFASSGYAGAEFDRSVLQVIPYLLMVRGSEVVLYERTNKGGEPQLHNQWSIGVGGHINDIDADQTVELANPTLRDVISVAALRELDEEFGLEISSEQIKWVGLMYLGQPTKGVRPNVSELHLAVVGVIDVTAIPKPCEDSIGRVVAFEAGPGASRELRENLAKELNMESWTKFLWMNFLAIAELARRG